MPPSGVRHPAPAECNQPKGRPSTSARRLLLVARPAPIPPSPTANGKLPTRPATPWLAREATSTKECEPPSTAEPPSTSRCATIAVYAVITVGSSLVATDAGQLQHQWLQQEQPLQDQPKSAGQVTKERIPAN